MENDFKNLEEIFRKNGFRKNFSMGNIIFQKGDLADLIYFLADGKVRAYTTYANGIEKTLCFVEKGNLVGEEVFAENPVRIVSVNAVTNVTMYCIDKNSLLQICADNKPCIEALFVFYMKKITLLSNFIFTAQFLNNDQKIAYYLYSNYKKDNEYIYYTHEQISAITGMSRVSTTKILNNFKDTGLIDLNYKYIHVLNIRGLEEIFQGMDFF